MKPGHPLRLIIDSHHWVCSEIFIDFRANFDHIDHIAHFWAVLVRFVALQHPQKS